MKVVNLYSLINVKSESIYKKMEEKFSFQIKQHEKTTLANFIKKLNSDIEETFSADGYIFDYKLIGNAKEFDILKNTKEFILNIELKSTNTTMSRMTEQLIENRFYLSKTGKKVYNYVYYAEEDAIYKLDEKYELVKADEKLLVKLMNVPYDNTTDIEALLSPEKFLVSPFNDVEKFIKKEYLLTQSQKSKLKNMMQQKRNLLIGTAGTGKTLLIYSLANELIKINKSVLIIHCAKLNNGQIKLNSDYNFDIIPIKELDSKKISNLSKYDLVIVDEMQRLRVEQVDSIIKNVDHRLIFSGDPHQILDNSDEVGLILNSDDKIKEFCDKRNLKLTKLKDKIRTNKNLYEFIKGIMSKEYKIKSEEYIDISKYVTFSYFDTIDAAKLYWNTLIQDSNTRMLTLPATLHGEDIYTSFAAYSTSFNVIGQEFDTVIALVGPNIKYSENGKLYSSGTYYSSVYSLFQNMTRTRKKLHFVIVNNEDFLNRLIDLL